MKILENIFILISILVIVWGRNIEEPGFPPETVKWLRNIREKCKTLTGASMESILSTDYGGFATDYEFKCYLRCTMIEMRTMDDNGYIDAEKVSEAFPQVFKDYGIPKLVATCGNPPYTDTCEKAYHTLKCYHDINPEETRPGQFIIINNAPLGFPTFVEKYNMNKLKVYAVDFYRNSRNKFEKFNLKNEYQTFLKYLEKFKTIDRKKFYVILKDVTRHFCFNTSLHGYRFIALKNISVTERFVWTFLVFSALISALSLISLSYSYENAKGSTITMTDSMYFPVYNFLFPAISFCNINKISKKRATEVAQRLVSNQTDVPSMLKNLTYMANIFFANYKPENEELVYNLQNTIDFYNTTMIEILESITPDCNFIHCIWKGRSFPCNGMFSKFYTPEGSCCSFNSYALRNWTFEGYNAERYIAKPKKLAACGRETGLKIIYYTDFDDYFVSEYAAQGIKLLIHDTYNYPEWNTPFVMLPPLTYTSISIMPEATYATRDVEWLSIKDRGCIFPKERSLTYYNNYTHENCLNECRIGLILKLCGCVPIYYINPYLDSSANLRICNLTDIPCLAGNITLYKTSVPGYNESKIDFKNHKWGEEVGVCDCPPTCEKREYLVRSTRLDVDLELLKNRTGRAANFSEVDIFYKNLVGSLIKKDVTKRWHALLGLLGGLLGISIGFSITGAFDIIYYYILRLFFDVQREIKIQQKLLRKNKKNQSKPNIATKSEPKPNKKKLNKTKIKMTKIKIDKNKINKKIGKQIKKIKSIKFPKFEQKEPFPYLE